MFTKSGKQSKGTVGVEAYQGRLRLRLPRQLYDGKQKYLMIGLADTPINRKAAEAKAKLIDSDIVYERFDYTLEKYGKAPSHLTVIEALKHETYTVLELWDKYFASKRLGLKAKTIEKHENFSKLFAKLGNIPVTDALEVKASLEKITTVSRTKDALMYLSAACKWAMKHGLLKTNPFDGMAAEMPKHRYMIDPSPSSFTEEERDRIIEAFKNDSRKGMTYKYYAPFVEFLFLTGCRPSEAIGLQWNHISDDCGSVSFEGSLVQIGNRRVKSEGSKNNQTRKLSVSSRLQNLLKSIKPESYDPNALVFPSIDGDSINYRNFSRRAWSSIVEPIKPDTTPYCCRDTFITLQLLKGVPSAIVAKWCDTSTQMIDKNYADKLKLTQLCPHD